MKLLLDTDVLLDVALDREPFVERSSALLDWCQAIPMSAWVAWHTVATLYYLLRSRRGDKAARTFISGLLTFVRVASGGIDAVRQALALPMGDLEDALQVAAALSVNARFVITRNLADYRHSPIVAIAPNEFLARFVER